MPETSAAAEPLVAIVIACFDAGATLRETLASARAQTYARTEIIVVDDGSQDGETLRLLDELETAADIMVLRRQNGGPSAARNTGISATRASLILPLDADDVIDPPYIAEAVQALQSRPETRLVYCRAEFFGSVTGPWELQDFSWPVILVHNLIFQSCLYRRADWAEVGGYDEALRRGREDHDFILRLLALGGEPLRLDGRYFHYRRSASSHNTSFGTERELLVQTSATLLRNNAQLYVDHADDLFRFIFEQQDRIADLNHRYQALERFRVRFPGVTRALRAPVKALSRLRDGRRSG